MERRGPLIDKKNVDRWYELPSGYRIGLINAGEFKMGAPSALAMIVDQAGDDLINFGSYRFYLPGWNAEYLNKKEDWSDPVVASADGNWLALNWLYAHRHGAMAPLVIHIPSRKYNLVEPRRILTAKCFTEGNPPKLLAHELVWENSRPRDEEVRISIPEELDPIEKFYDLDPFKIDTDVHEWKGGVHSVTPLREFSREAPADLLGAEKLKRAQATPAPTLWQETRRLISWFDRRRGD